ncbi:alkaline phosphatase D family protein [Pontiellaceae bacterium B12219]|nr:alkaline phosphatase D family protein [Pontiellaceae bacterium B12219]
MKNSLYLPAAVVCIALFTLEAHAATLFSADFQGAADGSATLGNLNSGTQTGTWAGSSIGTSTLDTADSNRGLLFGRDGLDVTANFSSAGSLASGVTITYDLGLRRTGNPTRTMMMKGIDSGGNVLFVLGLQGHDFSAGIGYERLVVFSEDFTGSPTGGGGGTITYLGAKGTFTKGTDAYNESIMHEVSLVLSESSFDVYVDGSLIENGNDIAYFSGAGTDIQALNFQADIAGGAWYDNFDVQGTELSVYEVVLFAADFEGEIEIEWGGAVSLAEAHEGTLEIDLQIMNQYEVQPLEVRDFYTACRGAFTGATPESDVAALCQASNRWKLGGPMLGDVTTTNVAVWVHLPESNIVEVTVTPEAGGASQIFQSSETNLMLSVRCEGLLPNTAYTYEVADLDGRDLGSGSFVTAPAALTEETFRIAFGSCFHKIGLHRPELMDLIRERGNRAMLVLGDVAVDDRKNDFGLINSDYLLRNLSPPWQEMVANVPVFAGWDDHDYWGDDSFGTETRDQWVDVEGLRKNWKSQWNNPDRDVDREGIYFQTQIGPIHYIALDTRSCRVNDERGALNSYLGEDQMNWLKAQINASTSPYILLSSGTMWSDDISDGKDSWGTWDTAGREEIFQLIDAKTDAQVILLSGDRHGARGFAIPRPGDKKIYEFEAASLGGVPGPAAWADDPTDQLFGYTGSDFWAFGELSFSTVTNEPQATFRLIDENGDALETIMLEK